MANKPVYRFPTGIRAATHLAIFVLAIVLPQTIAHGQTSFWISNGGGNYSNPGNWSHGVPPQGGSSIFNLNTNYTVDIDVEAINTNSILAAGNANVHWNCGNAVWGGLLVPCNNNFQPGFLCA